MVATRSAERFRVLSIRASYRLGQGAPTCSHWKCRLGQGAPRHLGAPRASTVTCACSNQACLVNILESPHPSPPTPLPRLQKDFHPEICREETAPRRTLSVGPRETPSVLGGARLTHHPLDIGGSSFRVQITRCKQLANTEGIGTRPNTS
jgi:hypothetical protein